MSRVADTQRIFWLDAAKAYGMMLVFYGHFVERVYQTGNEAALLQERLIYAFHMPLFIFIAGFFARTEAGRPWAFLKRGLLTRILPALFFSLLIIPGIAIEHLFPPDVENRSGQFRLYWLDQMAWAAINFLRTGFPLNTPVWFVICLFVVEFYHFLAVRVLRSAIAVALAIPAFWVSGAWLNHDVPSFSDIWFARESILLYGIYLLGYLLRRTQALERLTTRAQAFILLASTALLLSTFNLNPGDPHSGLTPVVLINLSQHGDPFLFAVTALAGCFAIAGLSLFTPHWRWVSWLGRNTLILMGLNGFFFAFVNHRVAGALQLAESQFLLVGVCGLVTALSLIVCIPFVWLLNRYLPSLVGRSRAPAIHSERRTRRLT